MRSVEPTNAGMRLLPLLLYLLFGCLLVSIPLHAQPTNRYEFRQQHSPDGIGKFYEGREIAHVMGHQAADWLERPEREEEEKTSVLVNALGLEPGQVVADI